MGTIWCLVGSVLLYVGIIYGFGCISQAIEKSKNKR